MSEPGRLVLASASASRRQLLGAAGVAFDVAPADLDEAGLIADLKAGGAGPAAIALALAEEKAVLISRRHPGRLVLGGDTVLALGAEIITKCANLAQLHTLLRRLSGKTHLLVSAAVLARDGFALWRHGDPADLTMRDFSDAFLEDYLAGGGEALLSSVGGYQYEGRGAQLFTHVQGDYFTILGLPLLAVLAELRVQGILPL